jgi:hypothetical protein
MMTISCLPVAEMAVAELPETELPVAELPAALSPHQNPRLPRSPAVIKPNNSYILKFFILFGSNAIIGQF